jgi:hypothetical protein
MTDNESINQHLVNTGVVVKELKIGYTDTDKKIQFNTGAVRNSNNKLRMDLITPEMESALAEVLTFGANKYGDRNYEKGIPVMNYIGSCKRHLNAFLRGIDIDTDSKIEHIKLAFTNLGMLITTLERFPELDDRPAYTQNK